MRGEQFQRAERVGAAPGKRRPVLRLERFRQHQQPVEEGRAAQGGCEPERRPRRNLAEQAADHRPGDEAGAEGGADQPVGAGASFRRGDVGHVGEHRGERRRGDAGDDAAERQPPEIRRHRHQHVVAGQPECRQQDDRPTPETVGQRADHRRRDELHARPQRHEQAVDPAGVGVRAGELLDQRRQHGDDDAHRHDVERGGDQDEGQGRAEAAFGAGVHAAGPLSGVPCSPAGSPSARQAALSS